MYILTDIAKASQDEKLRAAARTNFRGQGYAARRPQNRGGSGRRLVGLPIRRVLRARRAAQAC